jgi:hypothetical protein
MKSIENGHFQLDAIALFSTGEISLSASVYTCHIFFLYGHYISETRHKSTPNDTWQPFQELNCRIMYFT